MRRYTEDDDNYPDLVPYEDKEKEPRIMPEQDLEGPKGANGKPIIINDVVERFINAEVRVPEGEQLLLGKVVGLVYDKDGKRIGNPHDNPFLNTVLYDVQLEDGTSRAYGANVIAENM